MTTSVSADLSIKPVLRQTVVWPAVVPDILTPHLLAVLRLIAPQRAAGLYDLMVAQNHYDILGVTRQAEHDQIRRAYLTSARRWHPDRHSGKPAKETEQAEQAMRRVNQAWSVLGDKVAREAYDRQLVPQTSSGYPGSTGAQEDPPYGIRNESGVYRIDPRLLDPDFLNARRDEQLHEISTRSSFVLRAAPLLAVLGLLVAIFVFTAYARDSVGQTTAQTVPGPNLGANIVANDCVRVITGPALLEVPCTSTADGRVFGARLPDGMCPPGTDREVELSNGAIVCLDAVP